VPPAADARRSQYLLQPDAVGDINQRIRLVSRRAEIAVVIIIIIIVKRGGPARAGARAARELRLAPPAGATPGYGRATASGSAVPAACPTTSALRCAARAVRCAAACGRAAAGRC
jgi:hypothetical protein